MDDARFDRLLLYIAANMRRLRDTRGLTQEALAERANLSLRGLQEIEAGRVNVRITVLAAIAEALEVPPGALLKPAKMPAVTRGRPKQRPSG